MLCSTVYFWNFLLIQANLSQHFGTSSTSIRASSNPVYTTFRTSSLLLPNINSPQLIHLHQWHKTGTRTRTRDKTVGKSIAWHLLTLGHYHVRTCVWACFGGRGRGGPQLCPLPEFVSAASAAATAERPSAALWTGVQLSVGWVGISVVVMILVVGLAASQAT